MSLNSHFPRDAEANRSKRERTGLLEFMDASGDRGAVFVEQFIKGSFPPECQPRVSRFDPTLNGSRTRSNRMISISGPQRMLA